MTIYLVGNGYLKVLLGRLLRNPLLYYVYSTCNKENNGQDYLWDYDFDLEKYGVTQEYFWLNSHFLSV